MDARPAKTFGAAFAALLLAGCGIAQKAHWNDDLRRRAAYEFQCSEAQLEVTPLDGDESFPQVQGVEGCGQRAVYVRTDRKWIRNTPPTDSASEAEAAPGAH